MNELLARDGLAAVAWGAASLLLVAAGWRLAGRVGPEDPPAARVLHAAVFGWAVVVGVATLLGLFGVLTPAILLAGVASLAIVVWRYSRAAAAAPVRDADRILLAGWLALLAYWLGSVVDDGLLRFPTDWDSLMYHLPLVDQWLQARSLYAPRDAVWYNPGNNELVGLWFVAPFSGDFLFGLNNLPAVTLLSLGAIELARQLGLSQFGSALTGLAVVATYVVGRQVTDAENDVAAAGLFVTAVAYALRHARSGARGDLMLGAATIGLLAGVKYYALGYGFAAGVTLVTGALLARGPRAALRAAAVGVAGAVLLGGYWYLRNAWLTGTPLYPKGYNDATDVMSQWRPNIWSSTFLGSGRPEVLGLVVDAVRRMSGPCYAAAFLAGPVVAGWLIASGLWRRRRGDSDHGGAARVALALGLLLSGLIWGCIPFAVETWPPGSLNVLVGGYIPVRFGLSFLSLSVVALGIALNDLGVGLAAAIPGLRRPEGPARRWLACTFSFLPLVLFGLAATRQFFRGPVDGGPPLVSPDVLMIAANVGLCFAVCYACRQSWVGRSRTVAIAATVGLLLVGAFVVEHLAQRWHTGFTAFYDRMFGSSTYHRLAERDPERTNIGALNYRYYPCFGSRRQVRVARPVWIPTYESLRDYLRAHECTLVVAIRSDPFELSRYGDVAGWLVEQPHVFRQIHRDPQFLISEVDRDGLGRSQLRDGSPY